MCVYENNSTRLLSYRIGILLSLYWHPPWMLPPLHPADRTVHTLLRAGWSTIIVWRSFPLPHLYILLLSLHILLSLIFRFSCCLLSSYSHRLSQARWTSTWWRGYGNTATIGTAARSSVRAPLVPLVPIVCIIFRASVVSLVSLVSLAPLDSLVSVVTLVHFAEEGKK